MPGRDRARSRGPAEYRKRRRLQRERGLRVDAVRELLGQQRPQERPLVAPHAAGLVADAVGLDELGVDAEALAVAL